MIRFGLNEARASRPWRDGQVLVLLAFTAVTGVLMHWLLPDGFAAGYLSDAMTLSGFLLIYPLVEEVLFRGVIQGELLRRPFFARSFSGISAANVVTSALFVLLHLMNQPLGWAVAVALPSLALGYFRERYQGVGLPILLHVLFNGTFLAAGMP